MQRQSNHNSVLEDPGLPLVGVNANSNSSISNGSSKDKSSISSGMKSGYGATQKEFKYHNVGARLAKRKQLFERRRILADLCLMFAMLGVVLMVIETELCISGVFTKAELGSVIVKSGITLSTAVLLLFLTWYHYIDIRVFMIDNSMDDWRLAVTLSRGFHLALELLICAIHPIPGQHEIQMLITDSEKKVKVLQPIPVDVMFSLPMFLRFFLVCRVMMLHSRLFQDASSQSLGALNRINFNFRFIFKSLMNLYPEYVLTVLAMFLFIWASWAIRACEMYHTKEHSNFFNSMWLTSITFLTVGYGDIVPVSYCGRGIAVLTGIFGTGVTALVVAVLARKLELSRAEKYVHNFVIDIELDKQMKHAAANILKAGWLAYKHKKSGSSNRALNHQRSLLQSIYRLRELKNDQKKLSDGSETSGNDISREQTAMLSSITYVQGKTNSLEQKLNSIEAKLDRLLQSHA